MKDKSKLTPLVYLLMIAVLLTAMYFIKLYGRDYGSKLYRVPVLHLLGRGVILLILGFIYYKYIYSIKDNSLILPTIIFACILIAPFLLYMVLPKYISINVYEDPFLFGLVTHGLMIGLESLPYTLILLGITIAEKFNRMRR